MLFILCEILKKSKIPTHYYYYRNIQLLKCEKVKTKFPKYASFFYALMNINDYDQIQNPDFWIVYPIHVKLREDTIITSKNCDSTPSLGFEYQW